MWGVERRDRNENVFARANGLRDNAETAIACRGPGPARKKKKRCISSREEEEVDAHRCPCGIAIETRTRIVGECDMYKEEPGVLKEMKETYESDMEEFGTLLQGTIVNSAYGTRKNLYRTTYFDHNP